MKVLFIQPRNRSYVIMPSLGLGYLAAVLRQHGHEVAILNGHRDAIGIDSIIARLQQERIDLVGFQLFTYDMGIATEYTRRIKAALPEITAIAGGPHPSADPVGTLQTLPGLDFALCGEAEIGLPHLLEQLAAPSPDFLQIPGLAWRQQDEIARNPPAFVTDLDSLPFPAWDLLEPQHYPEAPHGAFFKKFPSAPIIVSRGCPCPCTFCAARTVSGGKFRTRSVANVIEELHQLKLMGIREFYIEDENFTFNKAFLLDFCTTVARELPGTPWSLPSGIRIDTLDEEMVMAMERAGCHSVAVGIEFGTQKSLDRTGKNLTLEDIRHKVALLKTTRMKITGFFLLGIPGETYEEMSETLTFALSLPLDRAQFNNYIPLPGTSLWEELNSSGKLVSVCWENHFVHGVSYVDANWSARELKNLQRKAYVRFYLRPRVAWGILREIRSVKHLFFLARRFIDALS